MKRRSAQNLKMIGVRDVRDINQTVFLHLIRERQPISRAEIVKATGLRPGTVSAIVNRLIKEKLVYEGIEGPSSGGRPPRFLYVNAESAYVVAVDIGVQKSLYAISDFNGRILTQRSLVTEGDPEMLVRKIGREVRNLVRAEFPRARIVAVGVSVPGLVDRAEGKLIVSPNQGWRNVQVRAVLEEELELPVYVENDANAAAFAELWYGPLNEVSVRTLLCVLVVEGLGTGLFINGELHVGTRIGLGGFGHMVIDPSGSKCSCGRMGCWETFASDKATLTRYNAASKPKDRVKNMSDVVALSKQGNAGAIEALRTTAAYLGQGIANLAHGLSPEVVVIGGEITGAWQIVSPIISDSVKSNYIVPPISFIVRQSSVQHPSLFGAIPIALQHCFRDTRLTETASFDPTRSRTVLSAGNDSRVVV